MEGQKTSIEWRKHLYDLGYDGRESAVQDYAWDFSGDNNGGYSQLSSPNFIDSDSREKIRRRMSWDDV